MTNPAGSFIWYELMTPDPDGAKAFYDAVVGWDVEAQSAGDIDYRMITIPGGANAGGVLHLTDEMKAHGARPTWLGYLNVDDIDATLHSVEQAGGKTLMPAHDVAEVGRFAMIADPQGAPIYIMKPNPPANQPDATSDVFSVDQPKHVRWNELATSDPAAAIAVYRDHFGWDQQGEMDMGPMGKYQFLQHGGVAIGAVMPTATASHWRYYIGVDDIDRAIAAIAAGGGKLVEGPHQIPGGEYSLHATDPQQVGFGLVGPRKS